MKNSVTRGVVFSWLRQAIIVGIGIYLMPFVMDTLGDKLYGRWTLINTVGCFYSLLCLGFGATVSRYTSKYFTEGNFQRLNETASMVFWVFVAMGAFVFLLSCVLGYLAPSLPEWLGWKEGWEPVSPTAIRIVIPLMGVAMASAIIGGVFGGVLMGIQRYDLERMTVAVGWILRLIATVAFLKQEDGLIRLACINLILTFTETGGHAFFAFKHCPKLSLKWSNLKRETWNEIYHFSGFALLEQVAHRLIYLTDVIVVSWMIGFEAAATFAVASRIASDTATPIEQIGGIFLSKSSELHTVTQTDVLKDLICRGAGIALVLIAGLCIGIYFFAGVLIETWVGHVGDGHKLAYPIVVILIGAQVVAVPLAIIRSSLMGMGDVKVPTLIYFAEAIANLVLSIVLVHYFNFGMIGVALGTLIPVIIFELCLMLPYALKKLNIPAVDFGMKAILPQVLPLLVLLAYCLFVHNWFPPAPNWFALVAVAAGGGAVMLACWISLNGRPTFGGELPAGSPDQAQPEHPAPEVMGSV